MTEPVQGSVKLSVGNFSKVSKKTSPDQLERMLEKRNVLLSGFKSETIVSAPVGGDLVDEMFNFNFNSDSDSDKEETGARIGPK